MNYITNIKCILESLKLNYKSLILLFIVLFILSNNNYIVCVITFIFFSLLSHLVHYLYHCEIFYPLIITHVYHHENSNFFSSFIQLVLEFVISCFTLFIKYFFNRNIFFNEWIIIFFYIFYTSLHNINYSIFHVNNLHKIHHKIMDKNFGPDMCDIIFNTKFDIVNSIENTDHYIINILLIFILVYTLKTVCNNDKNKKIFMNIFLFFYIIFCFILVYSTIYLFNLNKNNINKKYYKLIRKIVKIIYKKNDPNKWKKIYNIVIIKNNYLINKGKKKKNKKTGKKKTGKNNKKNNKKEKNKEI